MVNAARIDAAEEGLSREVWVVAGVVIIGMFMSVLDTTIVNVALETLSRDLNSPLSTIQWVTSGYLLSLAVVIPLAGWTTERFGSKRVWMISIAVFGVGSALCGLAWSDGSLIFFRVLQGFGGGMIMPVGMSLVAQTAGPQHVGRVMSVVGVPMLLGPILGPVVGGAIVGAASWRWIFFVNVPIAAIALLLAARRLSADSGRAEAGRLDWRGFLLLAPGLVGIVFGLSETETQGGISHPLAFGPIVAGMALVGAFAIYSYRVARPLIDVRLYRSRGFSAATTTTFFVGAALFGAFLLLPLYYQVARGASPLTAGLLMAPQGLGAALAMPIAGRLTDRIGGGRVALFGTVVVALATIPFATVGAQTSYALLGVAQFVRGIGMGSAMMPAMAAAFAVLGSAQVPRASGALNAIQRVGGAVGTALMAVVLEHQLGAVLSGASSGGSGALQSASGGAGAGSASDLAAAFAHTFWWTVGLSVLAVIPAAILAITQRRERDRAAGEPDGAATSPVGAPA
jgi:EmrB/QacA subfamily drug resistance transporter